MDIQWPEWLNLNNTGTQLIINLAVTAVITWLLGDKAGTKAAIKHEQQKEARALPVQLRILKSTCRTALEILDIYTGPVNPGDYTPPLKLPTDIFEQAITSTTSPLYSAEYRDLVTAIEQYLLLAHKINPHIEWQYNLEPFVLTREITQTNISHESPMSARIRIGSILQLNDTHKNIIKSISELEKAIETEQIALDDSKKTRTRIGKLFNRSSA